MPAYKPAPREKNLLDNFMVVMFYNALVIGSAVSLLWFVFPHFGVWRFVALVTVARIIIHGEFAPGLPADYPQ